MPAHADRSHGECLTQSAPQGPRLTGLSCPAPGEAPWPGGLSDPHVANGSQAEQGSPLYNSAYQCLHETSLANRVCKRTRGGPVTRAAPSASPQLADFRLDVMPLLDQPWTNAIHVEPDVPGLAEFHINRTYARSGASILRPPYC